MAWWKRSPLRIFLLRNSNHNSAVLKPIPKVLRVWLLWSFSFWFLSSFHLRIPKLSEACHKFGAVSRSCLEAKTTRWRSGAFVSLNWDSHGLGFFCGASTILGCLDCRENTIQCSIRDTLSFLELAICIYVFFGDTTQRYKQIVSASITSGVQKKYSHTPEV